MYNESLADVRGISPESRARITELQEERILLSNAMAQNIDADEKMKASLLNRFRNIEADLQNLWKFPFNQHQAFMAELKIPGCNCPYMDNRDSGGYRKFINKTCPWHK